MKKIEFTQEEIQEIIKLYKENNSLTSIGKNFLVSKNVIKRILQENNIQLRKRTTKHKNNTSIFHTIDNPEKAYWLGFLAADGINYRREQNAIIGLNLNRKDKTQLEKFKQFCESDADIVDFIASNGFSNNTLMSKLFIYSVEMSDDLTKNGVPPKKSLILQPPPIEEKYYLPFICGYFDGDGSISKASQYNNYLISIQGTKEILEWINSILQISNSLEKRYENDKNSYYIRCGGTNKPYKILNKLYTSCETHLDRKYKLYKNLETVVLNRNVQ